jgi:predicted RNase H-like nuclease (RuvC/YqgF family)
MSEPKRYDNFQYETAGGEYVRYEDYACLRAEVEFWKSASTDNGIACNQRANENQGLENEIARLKAEVTDLKSTADRFKAEVERWEFIHRLDSLAIKKQKEEVERLTWLQVETLNERNKAEGEVERLSKPAVIGGYNISEYIRMANSETLEFDNGDIFADMTLPERIKYIVESHARLKAEVERLQSIHSIDSIGIEQLKAEVERLTKAGDAMALGIEGDYNYPMPCVQAWSAAKKGKQS